MTSVFTSQSSAGLLQSSQQDVLEANRDYIRLMPVPENIIGSSSQPMADSGVNRNESYLNRFYLELMGDQLSSSLDRYTRREENGEPCTSNTTNLEIDEDNKLLSEPCSSKTTRRERDGDEKLLSDSHRETENQPQSQGIFCVSEKKDEVIDPLTKKGEHCNTSLSTPAQVKLNKSLDSTEDCSSISKLTREQSSLSTGLTSDTGKEESESSRSKCVQPSDVGGRMDRSCSPHTLSIIVEEDECHDTTHSNEQPWSQLLTNRASHSSENNQHKKHPQTLNDTNGLDKSTTDPAKIDVLTLVKNCNMVDGTDGGMMFPLFDVRTKMSRSQTIQVAGLMAIGIILVTGIMVWVFSPVILGIW